MGKQDHRIHMTKRVAEKWLRSVMCPEYRFKVLYGSKDFRNMVSLMHSFRDGRLSLKGLSLVEDLGIREDADGIEMWSRDREGLQSVMAWYEARGFETTGIW